MLTIEQNAEVINEVDGLSNTQLGTQLVQDAVHRVTDPYQKARLIIAAARLMRLDEVEEP